MSKLTDARENAVNYTYETGPRKLKSVASAYDDGFNSGTASVSYIYENDNLKTITHNDNVYMFSYDCFGNNTGIQVAGAQLLSYQYEDCNGLLTTVEYGNGNQYLYTYDNLDRVIRIDLKEPDGEQFVLYRYEYNPDGYLSIVHDIREDLGKDTIITKYFYDLSGRLIYVRNDHGEDYRYTYDDNDNLVKAEQGSLFSRVVTEYTYDKDNRELTAKTAGKTQTISYDGLGRISQKTWNTGTPYTTVYSYQQGAGGASTTSNQIASVTAGGVSTSYEYDGNENITKITSGTSSITYAYDELNQLIREDNSGTQQTIGYVYDAGGNLLEKRIYGYLPQKTITELSEIEPTDTIAYAYDTAYKDKLVSYDGSAITMTRSAIR